MYAASIMFGYFVRRVDRRFQLERGMGMLPEQQEDPVARLERLFSEADQMELVTDPDVASPRGSPDPDRPSPTGGRPISRAWAGRLALRACVHASPQPCSAPIVLGLCLH